MNFPNQRPKWGGYVLSRESEPLDHWNEFCKATNVEVKIFVSFGRQARWNQWRNICITTPPNNIRYAIKKLKSNKAAGPENIYNAIPIRWQELCCWCPHQRLNVLEYNDDTLWHILSPTSNKKTMIVMNRTFQKSDIDISWQLNYLS